MQRATFSAARLDGAATTPIPPSAPPSRRDGTFAVLPEQADLAAARAMPRGAARKQAAWDELAEVAARTHPAWDALLGSLVAGGIVDRYRLLTSPNALVVYPAAGHAADVARVLDEHGVTERYDSYTAEPVPARAHAAAYRPVQVAPPGEHAGTPPSTWNLDMVGAAEANAAGGDGAGLVYASIDTGVDWTHPVLRDGYRGARSDGSFDHDYSWFDASGPDRATSDVPIDNQQHGTHTTSTAVGRAPAAGGHAVGVAPAARWIGARTLVGSNRMEKLLRALEWVQAPTRVDGTVPRADLAPDVVGMSLDYGSRGADAFARSVANLDAAGIALVAAAGNLDGTPGVIASPAQYPEVVAVTSVDRSRAIAPSTPVGPSPIPLPGGGGRPTPKPDIAAPGVDVVGAVPGGGYEEMTGTSMAQPHVAGALLAVLSARPDLPLDAARAIVAATARDLGAPGFDTVLGAGLLDVAAAVREANAGR